jgi:hypothetical protein
VLGHGVMGSAAGSTLAVSRLSYEEALGGFSGVHLYWSSFNAEHPFSNRHDGVLGLHGGQSLDLPWERRLSPDMPRSCPRARKSWAYPSISGLGRRFHDHDPAEHRCHNFELGRTDW